jgi:hypothetical protein
MKTVPLGGKKAAGRLAEVDDWEFDRVAAHSWSVWEQDRGGGRRLNGPYAVGRVRLSDGRSVVMAMHIFITGIHTGIDHADGNGLNNQWHNMRPTGQPLNLANRLHSRVLRGRPTSSRFKGVTWARQSPGKGRDKWVAQIRVNGHVRKLGRFDVEEDAARAYNAAAARAWGEFALLNEVSPRFPWGDVYREA